MEDYILLWILEFLLLAASVMQILLERKRGKIMSLGWKFQCFLFPLILLIGLLLFQSGRDYIFPIVMLGLTEEIICRIIKRKKQKQTKSKSAE